MLFGDGLHFCTYICTPPFDPIEIYLQRCCQKKTPKNTKREQTHKLYMYGGSTIGIISEIQSVLAALSVNKCMCY